MQLNNRTIWSILILQELEHAEDPLPRKELAQRLKVNPNYVSQMLMALGRAGYIKCFTRDMTGWRRVNQFNR